MIRRAGEISSGHLRHRVLEYSDMILLKQEADND